jgi:hypothetical protein
VSGQFGFVRPNVFAIEPQFLGSLLVPAILIIFHEILVQKNNFSRNLMLGFLAFSLFLTLSRGAIFAMIFGLILVAILSKTNWKNIGKSFAIGTLSSHVFGLSKYSRAVRILAKRPVLQEQYARDIVELFTKATIGGTEEVHTSTVGGCMVIMSGTHGCMSCRGIESDTPTQTVYSAGMTEQEQQSAWNLYHGRKR